MPSEDSRPVKKEEMDSEDEKSLVSVMESRKKKPKNASPRSRSPKEAKLEKEEADDDFEQPAAKKSSSKTDAVQKKKKKKEEKKKGAKEVQQNGKKREKKLYDLPGQKRDSPEERDPLRIFYETLYKQVPNSEMAAFWMMESGLLSKEVAKKVYEKKQKRNQQQKISSPMKTAVSVKKITHSVTVKKKITHSVTVKKKTPSSPVSSQKKKTPESKIPSKQSKKRKVGDGSSEEESDDDFTLVKKITKKQRAA
ncbi:hypothetical protein F0562_036106 [Nyssa sinensis]|uniref:Uncharacterized protein n=1 Tax=Nyssa sinensis TaxID=561372 RepID=A0A5J5AHY6_9ASTE|nr:hypothetical protein F0562_036106 [Nyssa sinensis]